MKTLTVQIPENKLPQLFEFIKSIGLTENNITILDTEPTKSQILNGLKEAVDELNEIKAGKKKAILLKDFLNEL